MWVNCAFGFEGAYSYFGAEPRSKSNKLNESYGALDFYYKFYYGLDSSSSKSILKLISYYYYA